MKKKEKDQKMKRGRGRPSKFGELKKGIQQVVEMAELGLTDEQIARVMGVSTTTYYEFLKRNSKYSEAIKNAKLIADATVVRSLLASARGYATTETRTFLHNGEILRCDVKVNHPPNVASIRFWLANRSNEWENRKAVDVAQTITVKPMSLQDLRDSLEGLYGSENPQEGGEDEI